MNGLTALRIFFVHLYVAFVYLCICVFAYLYIYVFVHLYICAFVHLYIREICAVWGCHCIVVYSKLCCITFYHVLVSSLQKLCFYIHWSYLEKLLLLSKVCYPSTYIHYFKIFQIIKANYTRAWNLYIYYCYRNR